MRPSRGCATGLLLATRLTEGLGSDFSTLSKSKDMFCDQEKDDMFSSSFQWFSGFGSILKYQRMKEVLRLGSLFISSDHSHFLNPRRRGMAAGRAVGFGDRGEVRHDGELRFSLRFS